MEEARDRVFTGPAIGIVLARLDTVRGDNSSQGTNARDLDHFVKHFGFSTSEALQAATRTGGEIIKRGHEFGLVKENYLADLLLVDGDPLKNVHVLQDKKRLASS